MIIIVPEDLLFGMKVCTRPEDYYNDTKNKREIVFFGEEGALSSPPRLEKNKEDLEKYSYKGWDGREFLRWYDEFNEFLDAKQLRTVYPT